MNKILNFDEIKKELFRSQQNYAEAKKQAQLLDKMLGYECGSIEQELIQDKAKDSIKNSQQFWIGLELQSLQTPYSELVEMMNKLDPMKGDLWIDLGAGYGRLGVVIGFLYPEVSFLGYESIQKRVNEGNRVYQKWNLIGSKLECIDLTSNDFQLLPAEVYFIYDFGSQKDVYVVLEKIRKQAGIQKVKVIARGRGVKNWIMIDFPWLSQIQAPEHFQNWSLFRS